MQGVSKIDQETGRLIFWSIVAVVKNNLDDDGGLQEWQNSSMMAVPVTRSDVYGANNCDSFKAMS
jgi:hypothetical protein